MQYLLPKEGFNVRYVGYCLKSLDLSKYKQGAAIPHIYFRDYGEMWINATNDIREQEAIVARLDGAFEKIDALRANTAAQLDLAKQLFQSTLSQLLSPQPHWNISTIGQEFKTYAGGTPMKSIREYYEGGNIPWINSGEVNQKYLKTTRNYITEDGVKYSSAKWYPCNTILVAMYGATAAQVAILKFEATSNQAVCGLLPNERYVPEFVYYWFLFKQDELAAQAQGGAQPNLSQVKIKKMPIPIIPLTEQEAIVARLDSLADKVKQLQENLTRSLALCNDLKQALLREVFE